jgi:hypothetical protein
MNATGIMWLTKLALSEHNVGSSHDVTGRAKVARTAPSLGGDAMQPEKKIGTSLIRKVSPAARPQPQPSAY